MEHFTAPKQSANDETVKIIELMVDDHEFVNVNHECLSVEGSKTLFDVVAPESGYLFWLVKIGDVINVGDDLAIIYQEGEKEKLETYLEQLQIKDKVEINLPENFTVPAFNMLTKHALNVADFKDYKLVTTHDIQQKIDAEFTRKLEDLSYSLKVPTDNGRTLLIGAGRAASQVLSIFNSDESTNVVGFLDDTPEKQGSEHLGFPILGKVDDIASILIKYNVESIFCCAGNQNLRRETIELAMTHQVKLANAIHPSVVMDDEVIIGAGNYIGPQCFLGAQSQIGFGCFISSGSIFEHHNKVGHCVTTGPSVICSGTVTVEDFTILGSSITIEPFVKIGRHSAVASGCVITKEIAAYSTLKKSVNYLSR